LDRLNDPGEKVSISSAGKEKICKKRKLPMLGKFKLGDHFPKENEKNQVTNTHQMPTSYTQLWTVDENIFSFTIQNM